ncbi:phage transposase [Pseudogulbenkiania sp. NH8B]|uniref:Mu transposase C-terminal domain-containing protein n=1 Tax=Pseudogulbenkiania sp. (strain NH8B) TaxID=748280 RepID=UPI0002279B38|nr:Mu transposase C-terminal domain-containing protein [Pseudogulbenkiania sp. NH8B]BAK76461.1 phage transposase [Pseudogulbenkiania sp. NH8B]BAK76890.1 phage transposase [Pseudogulbenkiania sp. NH8B]
MSQPTVKTHYSAAELAAMKLPGLPGTIQGIGLRAKAESWNSRRKAGRGGGFEYALTSLPAAVQEAIRTQVARQLVASLPTVIDKPGNAPVLREQQLALPLTTEQQTVEAARLGVLAHIDKLVAGCGLTKERAMQHLLASVATGTADPLIVAMLRRAGDKRGRKGAGELPAIRTLKRWFALRDAKHLAPQVPQPDFTIPWWARDFLGYWQQPQKPSVELAYRLFCEEMQARGADMGLERILPSVHVVRRFLKKLGTVSRERGRMESRDLKRLQPFVRRDFGDLLPNDVWSADGHCFDAEVQHPITGRPFRPEITSIVDIATRRVVGWSIDLAESGLAVLDALRMAEEQAGMGAIFYVDNGSGYVNAMMKDEGVGLMGRIGLTMLHSIAYNSQARGVIERLHQTLWVNAAKRLPSYMGADMDAQARQRQFKITRAALTKNGNAKRMPLIGWDDFLPFCRERVAEYNARPHASLKGLSPDQAWQGFVAKGWQAERLESATLEALFRPRMERTVQRAEVRLFNNQYFNEALAELHGETVHVAYDIHDPHRVWVYLTEGRFVCTAEWNANRSSYVPTSAKTAAQEKRAAAQLRNLDKKRDVIEQERGGRPALTVIDSPVVMPGISGRDIVGAFERLAEPEVPLIHREPVRTINAASGDTEGFVVPPAPELRIRVWHELSTLAEAGGLLTEKETKWLASYAKSHEFRVMSQKYAEADQASA